LASAYINQICTATPPHDVHERFIEFIPSLIADERQRQIFLKLAKKAQIAHRYSFLQAGVGSESIDREGFYSLNHFPSTRQRMQKYAQHALELAGAAVQPVLATCEPASITHLIFTTCTGFSAPGVDLQIVRRVGLSPSVERTVIGFMGCCAAVNGLKAAKHIVAAQPAAKVLMVNLELCTLHLQQDDHFESLLAFLQFADGCAASLISAEPTGLELRGFHCDLVPDSEPLIQWNIGDHGFDMILSAEVPRVLRHKLSEMLTLKNEFALWAVHPGGRSILDAVETALQLEPIKLRHSRTVLSEFGNMSSATLMFVLHRILLDPDAHGSGMGMAFGPGLSLECLHFFKGSE
jgi:alpha-pyrone synthase